MTLARPARMSVGPRRGGREIEALCLQLVLHFLDRAIKLLIFALKFFPRIVVYDNVRINPVAFYYPLFAVFGINREFGFEKLSAVRERQWFANASYAAPGPLADELAESKSLKPI